MKPRELIKSRFFLPNVVLSLFLGASYFFEIEDVDFVNPEHNPVFGWILCGIAVLVMPFTLIKAREISFNYEGRLSKGESFVSIMIYFVAIFVTALIMHIGWGMVSNDRYSDIEIGVGIGLAGISVIVLVYEGFELIKVPKKAPAKIWVQLSNFIIPIYSGLAIVILWNGAFDLSWEEAPITGRKIFEATLFAFVLILPFQRLLWYESFVASEGKRDNVRALLSLLLSMVTAVVGVL